MELLGIPSKRTLEFDLQARLAALIDASFYQTAQSYAADLEEVGRLRNEIAGGNDTTPEALEALYKYVAVLRQLQAKFPGDQVAFSWCQTVSTKAHTREMRSFEWERVNVYYNIAAMHSLLALLLPVSTDNLSKQYQHYQVAATVFDQLRQLGSKGPEYAAVDADTADALKSLMLAQGMECFWFRAMKKDGGVKDTMAAKLAAQIVRYYESARAAAQRSPLVRSDWIAHMESKTRYFTAVAHYRSALALQEEKKYGAAVRCLTEAKAQLQNCNLQLTQVFSKQVEEKLTDSTRDNDFIYLQVVPEDVPPMPAALNMIRLLDFDALMQQHTEKYMERKYFKTLLPLELIEACNAYNERQDAFVAEQLNAPIAALNETLRSAYEQQTAQSGGVQSVPAAELQSIDASLQSMRTNNDHIASQLELVQRILQDEADTDRTLRAQHGTLRWTLPESSTLTQGFTERLDALKQYLAKGKEIDQEAADLYSTVDCALLTNSESQLPEREDAISVEVRNTFEKRQIFLAKVDAKSTSNRILKTLIDIYRDGGEVVDTSLFEQAFQQHMSIFNEDLGRVRVERSVNDDLVERINNQTSTKTDDAPVTDHRLTKRELYLVDFNHSLKLLNQVRDTIEQGSQFYRDLIASTNSLLVDTEAFVETRKAEKQQLSEQLTS